MLAIVAAERFLEKNAKETFAALGQLIANVINMPLALLGWLLTPLIEEFTAVSEETHATGETTEASEYIATLAGGGGETVPQTIRTGTSYPWWLAVLIVSVLLILLLTAMKVLRSRSGGKGASGMVFEKVLRPERKAPEARAGNRAKVRRYYREHLKREKLKGMRIKPSHTSRDILEHISPDTDLAAAASLREVYLKARYDENSQITPEDLSSAKAALKQLREDMKK